MLQEKILNLLIKDRFIGKFINKFSCWMMDVGSWKKDQKQKALYPSIPKNVIEDDSTI
jgi:hypothetical protein